MNSTVRRVRPRLLAACAACLVLTALWLAGVAPGRAALRDEGIRLVEIGDTLAATGRTLVLHGTPLTARSAYLLAFHHAQDAGDVGRMLAAATRLERLGERDLARHVRLVAAHVAASDPIPRAERPAGWRARP